MIEIFKAQWGRDDIFHCDGNDSKKIKNWSSIDRNDNQAIN